VLYDSGNQQCTTRLAQAMATHGDWTGLPNLPLRLPTATWLCVTAQLRHGHTWHDEFSPAADCHHTEAIR
jgi:hypothetical protein